MRYARIENNLVVEVGEFHFNPIGGVYTTTLLLVQDDTAEVGWSYSALTSSFSPPPPPVVDPTNSIEVLGRENYIALIRRQANDLIAQGRQYEALILLKTIGE